MKKALNVLFTTALTAVLFIVLSIVLSRTMSVILYPWYIVLGSYLAVLLASYGLARALVRAALD